MDGGTKARAYEQTGTCIEAACQYRSADTPCPSGCADGDCVDPNAVVQLAAGFEHTCARRMTGSVLCWGSNNAGQLGDGTTEARWVPGPVGGLDDAVEIAAAGSYTCARRASGTVACWGWNRSGQLGDGNTTQSKVPVEVVGLFDAIGLATATHHACAVRASGTVVCWGANTQGGLGDGTTTSSSTPVPVVGLTDVVQVALGATVIRGGHSCARTRDGGAVCWGYNYHGELGDGTMVDRLTPVSVAGLQNAVELGAGQFHTAARAPAGTVSQWGVDWATSFNANHAPALVAGLEDAAGLAVGGTHTCARKVSGTVVCWGSNDHGQLGDGTTTSRAAPTPVAGLGRVVGIGSGDYHTCAWLKTGGVACWGRNVDGSTLDRTTPVMLSGL